MQAALLEIGKGPEFAKFTSRKWQLIVYGLVNARLLERSSVGANEWPSQLVLSSKGASFLKRNSTAKLAAKMNAAAADQRELQPHLSPPAYLAVQSRDEMHLFGTVLSVRLPPKVSKAKCNTKKVACWVQYLMGLLRREVDTVATAGCVEPVQVVADWVLEEILVAAQGRPDDELKMRRLKIGGVSQHGGSAGLARNPCRPWRLESRKLPR